MFPPAYSAAGEASGQKTLDIVCNYDTLGGYVDG